MNMQLYNKYFQKSRVFCYPILGIKRVSIITPSQTFMSWQGMYDVQDARFVCHYANCNSAIFSSFSKTVLETNSLFEKKIKIAPDQFVFVFNFSKYQKDWNYILSGKYSRLSQEYKQSILNYFLISKTNTDTVRKILFPAEHFKEFATLLNVSPSLICKVGEVLDLPDMRKEEFLFDLIHESSTLF